MKTIAKKTYRLVKTAGFWNKNSLTKAVYAFIQRIISVVLKTVHILRHIKRSTFAHIYKIDILKRIRINTNRRGVYTQTARYFVKKRRWKLAKKFFDKLYREIEDDPREIERQNEYRFNHSLIHRIENNRKYQKQIEEYRKSLKKKQPKIAIVSAVSGRYDKIRPPEKPDSRFSYIFYCDKPTPSYGVYDVRPMPFFHVDPARMSRFIKANLSTLLPDYDYAVWIDANIMMGPGVSKLIDRFIESGKPVGAIEHSERSSVYEEVAACKKHNKEENREIDRQAAHLKEQNYDCDDLIESGFMMFNLKDKKTDGFFKTWWSEIDAYTRRDQLSVNYALDHNGITYHRILTSPENIRTNKDLMIIPHGFPVSALETLEDLLGGDEEAPYQLASFSTVLEDVKTRHKDTSVEIVYCVHNAYEDVKKCLASVAKHRKRDNITLSIVDDGSDKPTADLLKNFAKKHASWTNIQRNSKGSGYTKAANQGLRSAKADFMILLNSDTIVTDGWIEKMLDAAYHNESVGIVGPMSSAASHQSIPKHKSANNQTATNDLPKNKTPNDMNKLCEEWSFKDFYPYVPLIHGFCFGVKREVIDKIGYFSEKHFPKGYGEENDYCFRASNSGFKMALATNTYIYHAKSKSYVDEKRIQYMKKGQKTLQRLHGKPRIVRSVLTMEKNPLLIEMRYKAQELYR